MDKKQEIILGFSTGALHKTQLSLVDRLALMHSLGCNAVELGSIRKDDFIKTEFLSEEVRNMLKNFDYVSVHSPKLSYRKDNETLGILDKIELLHYLRPLDLVVFHPDQIVDFSVFDLVSFPVGFENMDSRKSFGRNPEDLDPIFARNTPFKFVLDMNHILSNDPTLQLAKCFLDRFRDRLVQIHLSGYVGYHEPLFMTRQTELIRLAYSLNVPIIIESVLRPEQLFLEKDYIERTVLDLE